VASGRFDTGPLDAEPVRRQAQVGDEVEVVAPAVQAAAGVAGAFAQRRAQRGTYRKGEAKRAKILQTALEIFAVEGYRGTSMRKVAAQCGLSMPGISGLVELFVSLAAAGSDGGHPAHAFFEARYRSFRETLAERIAEAGQQGRIRTDVPPERLARLTLAVADGIQPQWMVERAIDMSQAVEDLFRLLDWKPAAPD
jgi:AcrR family transcriptional regulator